jgi:hypothetical protein
MSRRIRSLKRNIRENITKIPSAKSIAKGTLRGISNVPGSTLNAAKYVAKSAANATVSGVKKTYFGKYEDEYLNTNERDTKTDDTIGSAWIKVYDVSESNKDKPDEIENKIKSVGLNRNNQEKQSLIDGSSDSNIDILVKHIKDKKYVEKTGIRNASRTLKTKQIVIPYSNIDDVDFDVNNLKDDLLNSLNDSYNLSDYYIEIEENGILNYYISTPIKNYLRYAIVKRGKFKDDKRKVDDLAKKEKQKKLDAKKSETKELLDGIGTDILGDNKIDTLPPCSKLANAYCYIHPFNVILYERNIMYGLKWEKVNFNPGESDSFENIKDFFEENKDIPSFNLIEKKIIEVYKSLSPKAPAPKEAPAAEEAAPAAEEAAPAAEEAAPAAEEAAPAAEGGGAPAAEGPSQTGGKQIGGGTEVIDLTGFKEVRDIVYDARYLDDFKSEKFYYIYEDKDNGIVVYYICKNSILDYRYNHKSWDKDEYYTDNSIDKLGLQSNLDEINNLNEKLTSTLESVREKARENGEINKFKELERQDRIDERFNDNAGKFGYYTTLLFVHTAKYIQDTFLAGIKTLFIASWNNVITGFLILLFIILVVIMGVALGNGEGGGENDGPNKKPKEENKDFISLLKSMPANINSAYADFNKFATDFGNMVTNGRRAVNDFADAMTGDNIPEDSVRIAYEKEDGRGGDNIIHFNNGSEVISAYKPIAKIIPKQNDINSTGQLSESDFSIKTVESGDGKLYVLDCTNGEPSKYFTKSCKLRKDYSLDTRFIKEPESDYEQIKIND